MASNLTGGKNWVFDVGDLTNLVVQYYRQAVAHVLRSEAVEPLAAFVAECEAHARLSVLITTRLRIPQVLASDRRNARNKTPGRFRPVGALAAQQERLRRSDSALVLKRCLLAAIRPGKPLLDLQHGG